MSVTTTDNPVSTALHRAANNNADHLRDYQVHFTTTNHDNAAASSSAAETTVSNPPDWPDDYRGMPPYRPINTGLDLSTRPWGGNPVGDAFVFTMFTGVWTVAVSPCWLLNGWALVWFANHHCAVVVLIEYQLAVETDGWEDQ